MARGTPCPLTRKVHINRNGNRARYRAWVPIVRVSAPWADTLLQTERKRSAINFYPISFLFFPYLSTRVWRKIGKNKKIIE